MVGHVLLVLDDRCRPLVDVVAPLVSGDPFEVFQPVGLGAHLHGIADHRVQVDEEARSRPGWPAPPPPRRDRR